MESYPSRWPVLSGDIDIVDIDAHVWRYPQRTNISLTADKEGTCPGFRTFSQNSK